MKRTITSIAVLLASAGAYSQNIVQTLLDTNNVRASVSNRGIFFHDPLGGNLSYEAPKGSMLNALYLMNVMAIGKDGNDNIKAAITDYEQSDFFYGPVTELASQYNSPGYQNRYQTLWPLSKAQVDHHLANWNEPGYTVPPVILNWPGNGNVANGEPLMLAPFSDLNGNSIYEPVLGEFPLIRGDEAIFCIMNDDADIHPSGANRMKLEVHLLFYQYAGTGPIANTTFIHAEAINRSTSMLHDFHFGSIVDFEIGGGMDDYIGTSVDQNMAYGYNGDGSDEPLNGVPGYGEFPPALGVITLNRPLYSHISSTGATPNVSQTYDLMKGLDVGGNQQLDDDGQPTTHAYSGYGPTGWTEATAGNAPGDRRSYISFEPAELHYRELRCYDYALVFSRKNEAGLFASVDSLKADAAVIQAFYDSQDYGCTEAFVGLNSLEPLAFGVYPNPAADKLTLSGIEDGSFTITALDGKVVSAGTISGSAIELGNLHAGCYLLTVHSKGLSGTVKFMKD